MPGAGLPAGGATAAAGSALAASAAAAVPARRLRLFRFDIDALPSPPVNDTPLRAPSKRLGEKVAHQPVGLAAKLCVVARRPGIGRRIAERMHRAAEHHHLPIDLDLGQFVFECVHHRFGRHRIRRAVDRQHTAFDVARRVGFYRIGIGDVKHDDGLETGAVARLFERVTAAGAIAERGDFAGIDKPELVHFGEPS